jgi:hypothetical protein
LLQYNLSQSFVNWIESIHIYGRRFEPAMHVRFSLTDDLNHWIFEFIVHQWNRFEYPLHNSWYFNKNPSMFKTFYQFLFPNVY